MSSYLCCMTNHVHTQQLKTATITYFAPESAMQAGHRRDSSSVSCASGGAHSTRYWRIHFQDSLLTQLAHWCCQLRALLEPQIRARGPSSTQPVFLHELLWFHHNMITGFQVRVSQRGQTGGAGPCLTEPGELCSITSITLHELTAHYTWPRVKVGSGRQTCLSTQGVSKNLWSADPAWKVFSSNMYFCTIWSKLLYYPKPSPDPFFRLFFKGSILFISCWLHRVLAVARGSFTEARAIFCCSAGLLCSCGTQAQLPHGMWGTSSLPRD